MKNQSCRYNQEHGKLKIYENETLNKIKYQPTKIIKKRTYKSKRALHFQPVNWIRVQSVSLPMNWIVTRILTNFQPCCPFDQIRLHASPRDMISFLILMQSCGYCPPDYIPRDVSYFSSQLNGVIYRAILSLPPLLFGNNI